MTQTTAQTVPAAPDPQKEPLSLYGADHRHLVDYGVCRLMLHNIQKMARIALDTPIPARIAHESHYRDGLYEETLRSIEWCAGRYARYTYSPTREDDDGT